MTQSTQGVDLLKNYKSLTAELNQITALRVEVQTDWSTIRRKPNEVGQALIDHYTQVERQLRQDLKRVDACVEALPDFDRDILKARFCDGYILEQVADKFQYSCTQINRRLKKALEMYTETFNSRRIKQL